MPIQDGIASVPDGGESARHFVNHLRLAVSLSEIEFDLALLGSAAQDWPVWRFVTTPDHFMTMHQGFAVAVEKYRARYGQIRAVEVDPAVVRFADEDQDG